jgi:hypothetical protein
MLLSFAYAQIHNEGCLAHFFSYIRGVINVMNILGDTSFISINVLNILWHASLNFINARFTPFYPDDWFLLFQSLAHFLVHYNFPMRLQISLWFSLTHYVCLLLVIYYTQ